MRYWLHWHNIRHEFHRRADLALLSVAHHLPGRLRVWVVVDSTNVARKLYPHPSGYAGPDGLEYCHIYDGAQRRRSRGRT